MKHERPHCLRRPGLLALTAPLRAAIAALTIGAAMLTAASAAAEEADSLFGPPEATYVAPGGLFTASVPPGWAVAQASQDSVRFEMVTNLGSASLTINRIPVPDDANPTLLLLKTMELSLSTLPNFQVVTRRKPTLAGYPGASVLGTYSYQGNIQYPRAIEVIIIVAGSEAYLTQFECFEPAAAALAPDLNAFYATFIPRPGGAGRSPVAPQSQGPHMPVGQEEALPKITF